MVDQIIEATEEMVGANHSTKDDTLNRALLIEHDAEGVHRTNIEIAGTEVSLSYEPDAPEMTARRLLHRDGSSISRATYSDLFTKIGVIYGNVDANTFNLPDDRGLFMRMWDDGAAIDPDAATRADRGDGTDGDEVGTTQADQNDAHVHGDGSLAATNNGGHSHGTNITPSTGSGGNYAIFAGYTQGAEIETDSVSNHSHPVSGDTASQGGDEARPKNRYKWGGIHY